MLAGAEYAGQLASSTLVSVGGYRLRTDLLCTGCVPTGRRDACHALGQPRRLWPDADVCTRAAVDAVFATRAEGCGRSPRRAATPSTDTSLSGRATAGTPLPTMSENTGPKQPQ